MMSVAQVSHFQDSLEALRSTPLPGEEFPYASSGLSSIKCCSKCGATKTPQWREGPCGPKTLCNACGVKRTRTLRALQEGNNKRPRATGSVNSRGKPETNTSSSLEASSAGGMPPLFIGSRRPQRRAAEEAAVRTARYARTGEWADASVAYTRYTPTGRVHVSASPSSSQDTALGPDTHAEALAGMDEVALTPLAAEAAARHGLAAMDSACFAAVNLMTIAVKESRWAGTVGTVTPTASGIGAGPTATGSPPAIASPMPHQRGPVAPVDDSPPRQLPSGVPSLSGIDLPRLYKTLPPAQVMELIALNAELERSLAAARDAGQSVAALAQLLAEKQAASLAARQEARAASRRMHRFLAALEAAQR